jgi:hypothetical protein
VLFSACNRGTVTFTPETEALPSFTFFIGNFLPCFFNRAFTFFLGAVYHVRQGGYEIRFYPNTKSVEEAKSVRGGTDFTDSW